MLPGMGRRSSVTAKLVSLLLALMAMPGGALASGSPSPPAGSGAPASVPSIGDVTILIVQLRGEAGVAPSPEQHAAAVATITARLASLPDAGTTITPIALDRIRLDLTDPTWADAVTRVATAPGDFRILAVPSDFAAEVKPVGPLPSGMPVQEVVGAGHVVGAGVGQDAMGQPTIDLQLDAAAARDLDGWAAGHLGEMIALMLDGVVWSAATINATQYEGHAQIGGPLEPAQAQELVAILDGGPLPVRASVLTVCPAPVECPAPSVRPEGSAST